MTDPPLIDRWWYPLWEKMCELDVPGLIHAGSTLNPHLHMNGAHYVNTDVAAVVELTTSRVLTDFPDLKLIIPHGGRGSPFHWNRMRSEVPQVKRPPSEYVREHVWFTTQPMEEPGSSTALLDLFDRIGWDRLLFATDYPHW